jgi:hypothetical protein
LLVKVTQGFMGSLAALLVVAALGLGVLSIANVGKQTVVACKQVNVLRVAIVRILQQGEQDLPHNSFLKGHPAELRQALSDYRADIKTLSPVRC